MIVIKTKDLAHNISNDNYDYMDDCDRDDPFYPVSKMKGLEASAVSKALLDIEDKLDTLIGTLNSIDECVVLELSMEKRRGKNDYEPDPFSCFAVAVMVAMQQWLYKYGESSSIVLARQSNTGIDMKDYLLKTMPDVIEKAFDLQPYVDDIMFKYGDAND